VHYHRSRRAKCSSSSALLSLGEKRPEKAEAKTGQGSAGAAGGFKAVEVKEKKEEADRALFSAPLWRSPPGGEAGVPGLRRVRTGCLACQTS